MSNPEQIQEKDDEVSLIILYVGKFVKIQHFGVWAICFC